MTQRRQSAVPSLALAVALVAAVSCQRSETTAPAVNHDAHTATAAASQARMTADAAHLANEVRDRTARYATERRAINDGYVPDPFCVEVPPLGGMGHHWVNGALVDPVFQPGKPEVVLYAPNGKGQLELVAVEYIVIDVGQPAPTFAGQPFDVGGTPVPVPHWSLHVWVHKTNPAGMFTPFNPDVHCTT